MNKSAPRRQGKEDRLTRPKVTADEIKCDFALGPLDTATRAMDLRWGVNRLPELVSIETAQKFGFSCAKLNEAVDGVKPDDTAAWAAVCIRGLNAMDAEATASGKPQADPAIWEHQHEGCTFAIIADGREWPAAYAARPGLTIYSMHEVAVALHAWKNSVATVAAVKLAFPGAAITAVRQRSQTEIDLQDEIPW